MYDLTAKASGNLSKAGARGFDRHHDNVLLVHFVTVSVFRCCSNGAVLALI